MTPRDSLTDSWERRMERSVKAILAVAVLGLVVTIAQSASAWRTKSLLEQRVEILEMARKDQQARNAGQDVLNQELIDESTRSHR